MVPWSCAFYIKLLDEPRPVRLRESSDGSLVDTPGTAGGTAATSRLHADHPGGIKPTAFCSLFSVTAHQNFACLFFSSSYVAPSTRLSAPRRPVQRRVPSEAESRALHSLQGETRLVWVRHAPEHRSRSCKGTLPDFWPLSPPSRKKQTKNPQTVKTKEASPLSPWIPL